jgi:predicted phage terminase large subunit-like protein
MKSQLDASSWCSLFQGIPLDVKSDMLNSEWYNRYTGDIREQVQAKRIVVSVDTASKTEQRHDYTVATVWLEDLHGNFYLLDVQRHKLEFTKMCAMIDKTAQRWKATWVLVEDKGAGTQYIQTRKTTQQNFSVVPISTNQQSKIFRFDGVTTLFEAGRVYLPDKAVWLPDYEKELISFPNGKYDDQVDSTSQFLNWAGGAKAVGGTKKFLSAGGSDTQDKRYKAVEDALKNLTERRQESPSFGINKIGNVII